MGEKNALTSQALAEGMLIKMLSHRQLEKHFFDVKVWNRLDKH